MSIEYRFISMACGQQVIIDADDYELITEYKWSSARLKNKVYARRSVWDSDSKKYKCLFMHRFILGLSEGDGLFADHINGDGLDNRRSNLRISSRSENAANSKPRSPSGIKGVRFHRNGWQSSITVNYKNIYLGRFKTAEEAGKAYHDAAIQFFGEFARVA